MSDLVGFLFCIMHMKVEKRYAYSILFDSCWMLPTWNKHDPLRLDSGEHCRNMTYYTRLSISRWSANIFHRGLLLNVLLCAFKWQISKSGFSMYVLCFKYVFPGLFFGVLPFGSFRMNHILCKFPLSSHVRVKLKKQT